MITTIDPGMLASVTGGTMRTPFSNIEPSDPGLLNDMGKRWSPPASNPYQLGDLARTSNPRTDPYGDRFRGGGGHDWNYPVR